MRYYQKFQTGLLIDYHCKNILNYLEEIREFLSVLSETLDIVTFVRILQGFDVPKTILVFASWLRSHKDPLLN